MLFIPPKCAIALVIKPKHIHLVCASEDGWLQTAAACSSFSGYQIDGFIGEFVHRIQNRELNSVYVFTMIFLEFFIFFHRIR